MAYLLLAEELCYLIPAQFTKSKHSFSKTNAALNKRKLFGKHKQAVLLKTHFKIRHAFFLPLRARVNLIR
jgi:hypothetical protein